MVATRETYFPPRRSRLSGSGQHYVLGDLLCILQIVMQRLHLLLDHPYRILTDRKANGELIGATSQVINELDGLVWVALGFPFAGKFTHKDTGQRRVCVGGVRGNDDNRIGSGGVETSEFEEGDLRDADQLRSLREKRLIKSIP
jgi:hypothetical protein